MLNRHYIVEQIRGLTHYLPLQLITRLQILLERNLNPILDIEEELTQLDYYVFNVFKLPVIAYDSVTSVDYQAIRLALGLLVVIFKYPDCHSLKFTIVVDATLPHLLHSFRHPFERTIYILEHLPLHLKDQSGVSLLSCARRSMFSQFERQDSVS